MTREHRAWEMLIRRLDYLNSFDGNRSEMEKTTKMVLDIWDDTGHEDGCFPCPFCGEHPTPKEELDENDERIYAIEHECYIDVTTGWNHDRKTVIDNWNRMA